MNIAYCIIITVLFSLGSHANEMSPIKLSEDNNLAYLINDKPLTDKKNIRKLAHVKNVLFANEDFQLVTESTKYSVFYDDSKTDSLAIDAAILGYRDKYAAATYTVDASLKGKFNIGLVTLSEFDGESLYNIYINNKLIANFQNPRTELDFHEVYFTAADPINLNEGDIIRVEAIPHSNGLIPEDGEFAWARGRWRAITFH